MGVLIKGEIWTQTYTQKTPCDNEGRDSDAFIHKRMPKIASKSADPKKRHGKDCPSQTSGETNHGNTLVSDFWPPELRDKKLPLFESLNS